MSTPETTPQGLGEWFTTTPLGEYLLRQETAYFDSAVANVFGYYALQIGLSELDLLRASRIPLRCRIDARSGAGILARPTELPVAGNSVDLVVLPHVLEFGAEPHQILREAGRILMPEGHLVLSGFNPWSLWGGRRRLPGPASAQVPWNARFIRLLRLKDWLSLLGFEIVGGRMGCYVPPFRQERWLSRCAFMEAAGDRWWPGAGGVYFLQAIKRVHGMRLINPRWNTRLAPAKKSFAAAPQKIADKPKTSQGTQ